VALIRKKAAQGDRVIEVGCELGGTSFLLGDSFDRTLLDLNPYAINLAEKAFAVQHGRATFIVADMFSTPMEDGQYDVVFNSGVIERFSLKDRSAALREYSRIRNDDGLLLIAFPNHYSIPYAVGYAVLNFFGNGRIPRSLAFTT
jgi:ubiquinone/menaquinone biosynthesis C-methylase UbiE